MKYYYLLLLCCTLSFSDCVTIKNYPVVKQDTVYMPSVCTQSHLPALTQPPWFWNDGFDPGFWQQAPRLKIDTGSILIGSGITIENDTSHLVTARLIDGYLEKHSDTTVGIKKIGQTPYDSIALKAQKLSNFKKKQL